jgi:hypothetical protein
MGGGILSLGFEQPSGKTAMSTQNKKNLIGMNIKRKDSFLCCLPEIVETINPCYPFENLR